MAQGAPITYIGGASGAHSTVQYTPGHPPVAIAVAQQALMHDETRQYLKDQAILVGGHAVGAAKLYGHKGLMAFQDYVQQGPEGISVVCFAGGVLTSIIAALYVFNFLGTVTDPFHYVLSVYMFSFGLATVCIEADTDRIGTLITPFDRLAEPVTRAQAWLHAETRILTTLRGRGALYLLQGALMLTQCMFCMYFLIGAFNLSMGLVCILASFGVKFDVDGAFAAAVDIEYGRLPQEGSSEEIGGEPHGVHAEQHNTEQSQHAQQEHNNYPMEPPIVKQFAKGEELWKESKDRLKAKTNRELWAFHQQSTVGDCNVPKPTGMFCGNAKEQWRLWKGLEGMPTVEAKHMFVARLLKDGFEV